MGHPACYEKIISVNIFIQIFKIQIQEHIQYHNEHKMLKGPLSNKSNKQESLFEIKRKSTLKDFRKAFRKAFHFYINLNDSSQKSPIH